MTSDRAAGPVGLVGLGAMGSPIAGRMLEGVGDLVVYDIDEKVMERVAAAGAMTCSSVTEVADIAQVVFMSLPGPESVSKVTNELIGGRAVEVIVDLSSTGQKTSEEVAAVATGAGVGFVDAPVSGGPRGASAGRLTTMIAGSQSDIERVSPLLAAFVANVIIVGSQPGQGQLTKLLNNLMSATSIVITGEAMSLAAKAGLDPAVFLEAVNASSGRNTASSEKYPQSVLTGRFDFGFKLRLMAKDTRLCLSESQRLGVPMILGGLVQQMWAAASAVTDENADVTEMARVLDHWAGTGFFEDEA